MHEATDLEARGAQFVKNEIDRFLEAVINGKFEAEFITKTNPPIETKYARVPTQYKELHKQVWSSSRGQEIMNLRDQNHQWMWRKPVGYAVSEHPSMSILFIWYMPYCIVIGLDGPICDAVVAYCKSEGKVNHSRVLYTDEEIEEFDRHYGKVVYLENYVTP